MAALSIPASVLAAGNGSAQHHAGMNRHTATAQHISSQHGTTKSNGNGAGDRDVPGAANDPSAPRHDHDNGKGNDCDPGLGGSPNDTGNDRRFGEGDSTCQRTSGQKSPEKVEKGNESKKGHEEQSPPTVTHEQSGSVSGASGGHGGGGVNAAGGGVAAAAGAAAAKGVGLANTGAKLPIFGGLGVLLIALGTLLMRRRRLRAQEI